MTAHLVPARWRLRALTVRTVSFLVLVPLAIGAVFSSPSQAAFWVVAVGTFVVAAPVLLVTLHFLRQAQRETVSDTLKVSDTS